MMLHLSKDLRIHSGQVFCIKSSEQLLGMVSMQSFGMMIGYVGAL